MHSSRDKQHAGTFHQPLFPAALARAVGPWWIQRWLRHDACHPGVYGQWGETDVYTSKHSITGNMDCALLEVEAGGQEETKLFQTHECGQGGLPGRGVLELVLKDG